MELRHSKRLLRVCVCVCDSPNGEAARGAWDSCPQTDTLRLRLIHGKRWMDENSHLLYFISDDEVHTLTCAEVRVQMTVLCAVQPSHSVSVVLPASLSVTEHLVRL